MVGVEIKIIHGGLQNIPSVPKQKNLFGYCNKVRYTSDFRNENDALEIMKDIAEKNNPEYRIVVKDAFIQHKKHSRYSMVGLVIEADYLKPHKTHKGI